MKGIEKYIFKCPGCSEETVVDENIKEESIENGCISCGCEVEPSNFEKK